MYYKKMKGLIIPKSKKYVL